MTGRVHPIGTASEGAYTLRLYSDGTFKVYCTAASCPGLMDEGDATMGEVSGEDAATYLDAWLEDLRCLVASYEGGYA